MRALTIFAPAFPVLMKRTFGLGLALSLTCAVQAQVPDTSLAPVMVPAVRAIHTLPRMGRHLQVIDSTLLHGAARPEVSEVLRTTSLVDVRQRGPFDVQTDLGLRGGTFDQALVLVDGIPMSDPQTGHHLMDLPVLTDALERVEVLYGGASRVYGAGAFSGAINLVTRVPSDGRGQLTLDGGQYGSYRARVMQDVLLGRTGLRIGATQGHSDGYVANSDFDQTGAQLDVHHARGRNRFRLQAAYNHKRFGAQNFYSSVYPLQQEITGTGLASAEMRHDGDRWKAHVRAYYRQHEDEFQLFREDADHYRWSDGFFVRNGNDTARFSRTFFYTYHNRHRTQVAGVDAGVSRTWTLGTTGFGVHARDEHIFSNVLGEPLATPKPFAGSRDPFTRSDQRSNVAVRLDHRLQRERWTVDAGVLLNLNTAFAPEWAPGIDVVRLWNKGHSTYASAGRAFRFPTWTDLYYNRGGAVGSKDLQPEHADQLEIGHRLVQGDWSVKVAAWRRQGRDLIDWVQRPGETTVHAANLTEVDINGVELGASWRTGKGRGGLLYAYQWTDRTAFAFTSLYVLDHLTHNTVLWWRQELPAGLAVQANVTWKERFGSYVRFSDGALTAYPSVVRADLRVEWTRGRLTLFGSAYNLLDAEQVDRANVPLPGRWISGGLQLRWRLPERTGPTP